MGGWGQPPHFRMPWRGALPQPLCTHQGHIMATSWQEGLWKKRWHWGAIVGVGGWGGRVGGGSLPHPHFRRPWTSVLPQPLCTHQGHIIATSWLEGLGEKQWHWAAMGGCGCGGQRGRGSVPSPRRARGHTATHLPPVARHGRPWGGLFAHCKELVRRVVGKTSSMFRPRPFRVWTRTGVLEGTPRGLFALWARLGALLPPPPPP